MTSATRLVKSRSTGRVCVGGGRRETDRARLLGHLASAIDGPDAGVKAKSDIVAVAQRLTRVAQAHVVEETTVERPQVAESRGAARAIDFEHRMSPVGQNVEGQMLLKQAQRSS